MKKTNFAAIDIGSNAARLLIASAKIKDNQPIISKLLLLRYPLRLGEDAFGKGRISAEKFSKTVTLLKSYRTLLALYDVLDYRACATAAMREAENGELLVEMIRDKTDIKVDIISGKEEAGIVASSYNSSELASPGCCCFYVDVGGGSTEVTLAKEGKIETSKSFKVGTLRMLAGKVAKSEHEELLKWVSKHTPTCKTAAIVGLGGNISKLYRLANLAPLEKLSYDKLTDLHTTLSALTVEQRMEAFNLKPDRADVIVPAAAIFTSIMNASHIDQITVPTVSIADGIIHRLVEKYRNLL